MLTCMPVSNIVHDPACCQDQCGDQHTAAKYDKGSGPLRQLAPTAPKLQAPHMHSIACSIVHACSIVRVLLCMCNCACILLYHCACVLLCKLLCMSYWACVLSCMRVLLCMLHRACLFYCARRTQHTYIHPFTLLLAHSIKSPTLGSSPLTW